MCKFDKPTTEIVIECANVLKKLGKKQFTRQDIINLFKWKYPSANENTINPTIQGLSENAIGGAPNAVRQVPVLRRIEEGIYELI
jgi:hypothetical protein